MAQIAEISKFRQYVKPEPWRDGAAYAFRSFATIREGVRRGSRLDREESVAFCQGPAAGEFAEKIAVGLEAAGKAVGCDTVCELTPQVVSGLPKIHGQMMPVGADNADAFVFGSMNTVVFGLVRADGLVTPVVFNDRGAVLVQKGHGPFATLYDEQTDLARLLKDNLTPRSFV